MKSLLRCCVALTLILPSSAILRGQASTEFEVATIRPTNPSATGATFNVSGRRISIHNQTVVRLLMYAYDVNETRIEGAPAWCGSEHFDIDGALETGSAESRKQVQKVVQALLAERFALKLHHEQRPMQAFVLRVASGGAKLTPSTDAQAKPDQQGGMGEMRATAMTIEGLTAGLKYAVGRPVVDETGLKGRYDFVLRWTPDGRATDDPAAPPPLPTALKEQLGLKLDSERRPVDVVVVDSVQPPSAN